MRLRHAYAHVRVREGLRPRDIARSASPGPRFPPLCTHLALPAPAAPPLARSPGFPPPTSAPCCATIPPRP